LKEYLSKKQDFLKETSLPEIVMHVNEIKQTNLNLTQSIDQIDHKLNQFAVQLVQCEDYAIKIVNLSKEIQSKESEIKSIQDQINKFEFGDNKTFINLKNIEAQKENELNSLKMNLQSDLENKKELEQKLEKYKTSIEELQKKLVERKQLYDNLTKSNMNQEDKIAVIIQMLKEKKEEMLKEK